MKCRGPNETNKHDDHKCIRYVIDLFREIVGSNTLEIAISKINNRLKDKLAKLVATED